MDFLRGSTNTWYFLESMNDPNLLYFPIFNKHWVLFDQSCPNLPPFCCQRMIVNLSRSLVIVPPRWYQPSIQGIAWYCIVLYDVSTSHPRPPLPTCPSMISDGCNPTNSSVIPALTSPLPLIHRGRGEGGGWVRGQFPRFNLPRLPLPRHWPFPSIEAIWSVLAISHLWRFITRYQPARQSVDKFDKQPQPNPSPNKSFRLRKGGWSALVPI